VLWLTCIHKECAQLPTTREHEEEFTLLPKLVKADSLNPGKETTYLCIERGGNDRTQTENSEPTKKNPISERRRELQGKMHSHS